MATIKGPTVEFPNGASADVTTFAAPFASWAMIIGAGSTVLKDGEGASRTITTDASEPAAMIPGPWSAFTSTTATRVRMGCGLMPRLVVPATGVASGVTIADAGSFTAQTTAEGATQEIYQTILSAQTTIPVDIAGGMLAAGTPLAAFADNAGASAPGITLANSKAKAVRWNNQGTQTAVWYSAVMPQNLNDAATIVLHALISKSGATVGDAVTLTVTAFFQTAGALHDADVDCGGTSSAIVGDATAKTVSEVTLTIAAADVPASPSCLSFTVKPTDGTLGTDDAMVEAIWFEVTPKLMTS